MRTDWDNLEGLDITIEGRPATPEEMQDILRYYGSMENLVAECRKWEQLHEEAA
jgi:hypothetical protein